MILVFFTLCFSCLYTGIPLTYYSQIIKAKGHTYFDLVGFQCKIPMYWKNPHSIIQCSSAQKMSWAEYAWKYHAKKNSRQNVNKMFGVQLNIKHSFS